MKKKPRPHEVPTSVWKSEPLVDRIHHCKCLLYLKGFLTEPENDRIQKRILKWIEYNRTTGRL